MSLLDFMCMRIWPQYSSFVIALKSQFLQGKIFTLPWEFIRGTPESSEILFSSWPPFLDDVEWFSSLWKNRNWFKAMLMTSRLLLFLDMMCCVKCWVISSLKGEKSYKRMNLLRRCCESIWDLRFFSKRKEFCYSKMCICVSTISLAFSCAV